MKREIKFRAWIPNTGWLAEGFSIAMDGTEWYDDNGDSWPVCDLEIMQFTGLKDKNGREIYEGDILQSHYGDGPIGSVLWNEKYACFDYRDDNLGCYAKDMLQIIGNIYENPELLNK